MAKLKAYRATKLNVGKLVLAAKFDVGKLVLAAKFDQLLTLNHDRS